MQPAEALASSLVGFRSLTEAVHNSGDVSIGAHGVGGAKWSSHAALYLDFWVSALPAKATPGDLAPIYEQYADATGHAPPLRDTAKVFWQSRNRYKSSDIALSIADRYQQLDLDVGVLVIDYKNQLHDGDFAPNPACCKRTTFARFDRAC